MNVVCAWCGKDMGEKNGKGVEGVSHGLCQECLAELEATIDEIFAEREPGKQEKKTETEAGDSSDETS